MTSFQLPVTCRVQVAPPSVLRYRPVLVAASRFAPLGEIASRFTKYQLLLFVLASCVQVLPPSLLLKTPAPRTASALAKPSPVPAYITLALVGSTIRLLTARLAMKSSMADQVVLVEQQLVVFQMPPETPPTKTVLALIGRIARMRPPTLSGPA